MRTSKYVLYTLKEIPKNIDTISHQLMLKAGLIRQVNTGLYIWLPNGLKVLQNIKKIIRYEMNLAGAIEICFPILQPATLWKKSNRFSQYGKELVQLHDRHNNQFILSPTYEEIATEFVKKEILSYKKLPIVLYQIQTKFRDEVRPRFGIIRSREFIMKDAYSFHKNSNSLKKVYQRMYATYEKIFNKMHIKFHAVQAECGIIGGSFSHEFQALSKFGEDKIILHKQHNCIKNMTLLSKNYIIKNFFYKKNIYIKHMYQKNIHELNKIFYLMKKKCIKMYIIKNPDDQKNKFIGYIIRGDHTINIKKIIKKNIFNNKIKKIIFPDKLEIQKIIRKIKLQKTFLPIIIDTHILYLKKIIPITLINEIYYTRDFINQNITYIQVQDIIHHNKTIKKNYKIKNCIEIGHIFQIGVKYSKIFDLKILNKTKINKLVHMGCYGIGVSRLIAAIIEQNHDKYGIIWPDALAPFQVVIIPIFINKCKKIKTISEKLYYDFKTDIDVLLEDRHEQTGIIFSDINLIGIPNIIIINNNTIKYNTVEYQQRKNIKNKIIIHINQIKNFIINKIYNTQYNKY
ncbi:proline--tRNA ligase [Buchnera aphidicola (Takecallis taiwana)]|uniref:proline--tRNA ligase n=1 Tax=Buchnera aphidicola TaxID=9 RepID=UPI0031B69F1C